MNAITKTEAPRPSLIAAMAQKFNMDPRAFEATVRSTVMPSQHTNEQFAALMMVAKEYELNPLTKEIYAFPAKGGGIVPVVSIDGWVNLVNSHPACDGFEFDFEHIDGKLISCTCRMYRKDRNRPVTVTEYLAECKRNTDPWKMEHRMLRHKAMIQASRYAFGFSGIYDEDEGSKIADMRDVTPPKPPVPPVPPDVHTPPEPPVVDHVADGIDADHPEYVIEGEIITDDGEIIDDTTFFERLEEDMACASDAATVEEIWTEADPMARFEGNPNGEVNQAVAMAIRKRALKRVGGAQ